MKAISIKQPWASLIVEGVKDIENRTWPTKFRGRVLVHASSVSWSWDKFCKYIEMLDSESIDLQNIVRENYFSKKWLQNLPKGVIIGSIEIVDCVINNESIWAEKTKEERLWANYTEDFIPVGQTIYNWVLANPIKFPEPIPAKGKLGFWEYPNILAEPEETDGPLYCNCRIPVKEINQVSGDSRFGYYCRYCGGRWYK